ncbi:MAG: CoA transferase, partial [Dehalococcoidia bacterium]|nr:CoA transferase [Dehalococcoidia bacterium]
HSLTGYATPKMGSASPVYAPYQCFQSADRYVFIGVTNDKFWQAFCRALGLDALAADPLYASREKRLLNRDLLTEKLADILSKIPGDEILSKLDAAGVPCAPVSEIPELLEHPQVQARQIFFNMEHPDTGAVKLANLPGRGSEIGPVKHFRAPHLGEHTREILLEAGYTETDIDSLAGKGVILRG